MSALSKAERVSRFFRFATETDIQLWLRAYEYRPSSTHRCGGLSARSWNTEPEASIQAAGSLSSVEQPEMGKWAVI